MSARRPDPARSPEYRTLNACAACSRQWDVSFLAPGESVRCECGVRFAVEFRAPRSPRALRCSSCGANLVEDAKGCGYCGAQLALEDRGLSSICPGCWSRLPARAKHCLECGLAIEPQALTALPEESRCPRCSGGLRARAVEGFSVVECASCAGLWFAPGALEGLCDRADEEGLAARVLGRSAGAGQLAPEAVRYLPCPICKDLMTRRNFAQCSGVILDLCREHGLWLDRGELEKILDFVRAGGLDKARERELARLKAEQERALERIRETRSYADLAEGLSSRRHGRGATDPMVTLGEALWSFFT